jgi:hypothetical protein
VTSPELLASPEPPSPELGSPELSHAAWFKSSYSGNNNGCVEVARLDGQVYVRDSKLGERSPVLGFTSYEWACFVAGVRAGELQ